MNPQEVYSHWVPFVDKIQILRLVEKTLKLINFSGTDILAYFPFVVEDFPVKIAQTDGTQQQIALKLFSTQLVIDEPTSKGSHFKRTTDWIGTHPHAKRSRTRSDNTELVPELKPDVCKICEAQAIVRCTAPESMMEFFDSYQGWKGNLTEGDKLCNSCYGRWYRTVKLGKSTRPRQPVEPKKEPAKKEPAKKKEEPTPQPEEEEEEEEEEEDDKSPKEDQKCAVCGGPPVVRATEPESMMQFFEENQGWKGTLTTERRLCSSCYGRWYRTTRFKGGKKKTPAKKRRGRRKGGKESEDEQEDKEEETSKTEDKEEETSNDNNKEASTEAAESEKVDEEPAKRKRGRKPKTPGTPQTPKNAPPQSTRTLRSRTKDTPKEQEKEEEEEEEKEEEEIKLESKADPITPSKTEPRIEKDVVPEASKNSHQQEPATQNGVPEIPQQQHISDSNLPQMDASLFAELPMEEIAQQPQPESSEEGEIRIAVMNVGGPVWAVDWCPISDPDFDLQFFAVGVYNNYEMMHILGRRYNGEKNTIQIWCAGKLGDDPIKPESQPFFALGIAHENDYIVDLKWCPNGFALKTPVINTNNSNNNTSKATLSRLGLLAATFGNGSVCIYSVPFPQEIFEAQKNSTPPTYPLIMKLQPVYETQFEVPLTCLRWSSSTAEIIMGFSDGSIGLVSWHVNAESQVEGSVRRVHGHNIKTTSLAWCPLDSNLFMSVGFDAQIKLWDKRYMFQPGFSSAISGGWPYHICWEKTNMQYKLSAPLVAMDDSSVRRIEWYSHKGLATRIYGDDDQVVVWDVDVATEHPCAALCSADGTLKSVALEGKPQKRRTAFVTLIKSSLTEGENGTSTLMLKFPSQSNLKEHKAEADNSAQTKTLTKPLHPPIIALHKVTWNPNSRAANWILCGGSAGLLCLRYVQEAVQCFSTKVGEPAKKKRTPKSDKSKKPKTRKRERESSSESEAESDDFDD